MAEAARRVRESDVVRRLIARPIRFDPLHIAPLPPVAAETPDAAMLALTEADPAPYEVDEPEEAMGDDAVVARLQAEMALMKAILMAERAETAALRAQIAAPSEPETLGPEALATRDRWAGMVDRILLSAR